MGRSKLLIIVAAVILLVSCLVWWRYDRPVRASITSLPTLTGQLGQRFEVPIVIDTKNQTINAAEIYLKFNPKQFEVVEVTKDGSFFQLWVDAQPSFSNSEGTITFAGGLPTPGFQGKGQIGTIKIKAKTKGFFQLDFSSKTQALLNDGQGTAIPLQLDPISVRVK